MLAEMAASAGGHFYFGLYHFLKRVQIEVARYPRLPINQQERQDKVAAFQPFARLSQWTGLDSLQPGVFQLHSAAEELAQDADS
jgi:DNA-binding transcriptional regulator of glucitol operon